jgi:subtilisin family serine protease
MLPALWQPVLLQPLPLVLGSDRTVRRGIVLVGFGPAGYAPMLLRATSASHSPSADASVSPLDVVRLRALMQRTRGRPSLKIALVDGPVAVDHPHLAAATVQGLGDARAACMRGASDACAHGTLVAGVLVAARESGAPGICPDCTLLVRPIFSESANGHSTPATSLDQLARAIVDGVDAGARLVNVSAALAEPSCLHDRRILDALDHAAARGSIVIVAAGNQATLGSSAITRHPWVVPVVACDTLGRPTADSNLSHSIARNGIAAPGENIASLDAAGGLRGFSGTSAAAPVVTGTLALLWSLFPAATASDLRLAVSPPGRRALVPPLLDASVACASLRTKYAEAPS